MCDFLPNDPFINLHLDHGLWYFFLNVFMVLQDYFTHFEPNKAQNGDKSPNCLQFRRGSSLVELELLSWLFLVSHPSNSIP